MAHDRQQLTPQLVRVPEPLLRLHQCVSRGVRLGERTLGLRELRLDLPPLAIELDEDAHLATDRERIERLEEEVDRASLVAAEHARALPAHRRDEDDGDVPRALHPAHELRELEPVHLGHLHVEQRQREVVAEQQLEGLLAGASAVHFDVLVTQESLERNEVVLAIVDEEALGMPGRRAVRPPVLHAAQDHRSPPAVVGPGVRRRKSRSSAAIGSNASACAENRSPSRAPRPRRPPADSESWARPITLS